MTAITGQESSTTMPLRHPFDQGPDGLNRPGPNKHPLYSELGHSGVGVPIKLPIALVIGGWETAASSIAKFVWVLQTIPYAEHETAWNYLVSHPEMVESAVTELERLYSTTSADDMPRRVMAAVTLPGGMELQPGQVVIPSHDAANRDPKVFDAPDRVDFGRSPNPHLSFGYGAHHCIGRYLGHMEVVTAIKVLTQEMPDLRLAVPADQIPFKPGHTINGPVELPVTWT